MLILISHLIVKLGVRTGVKHIVRSILDDTTPVAPVPLQVGKRDGNWAWRLKNTCTETERGTIMGQP